MIKPPASAVCRFVHTGVFMANAKNGSATRWDIWEYIYGKPVLA
jgi:hypothetical protein